jgi:hypothetical protein
MKTVLFPSSEINFSLSFLASDTNLSVEEVKNKIIKCILDQEISLFSSSIVHVAGFYPQDLNSKIKDLETAIDLQVVHTHNSFNVLDLEYVIPSQSNIDYLKIGA